MDAGDDDKRSPPTGPVEDIDRPLKPEDVQESSSDDGSADESEKVALVDEEDDDTDSDSMLEDALEALTQVANSEEPSSPEDICTDEEGALLRKELREVGPIVFCERNIDSGKYNAKKLLSAFGVRIPAFLEGQPDEAYEKLLSVAIARELSRRIKLPQYNTVDDAVDLIKKSSNIILITGAGISTSLGIPDFRSKGTGLYSKLEHLGLADPQEVFDISLFREDPSIFYSIAKDIIPDINNKFTPTHKFIAMLHARGKLLTNYSQNIDNLEIKAGVPREKLIQCHGSFGSATCIECNYKVDGEVIFPDVRAGILPRCTRCIQNLREAGGSVKRKQPGNTGKKKRNRWEDDDSDNDSEYDIPTAGVMKPDITFFGESLPDEFGKRLTEHDRDKVDLVIVIGTSLKVTPVSEVASWLPEHIPQIYVSREPVRHIEFDIDLLGDCDVVVAELCRRLEWPLEHEMVPRGQEVDVTSDEARKSRHVFVQRSPEEEKDTSQVASTALV